MDEVDRGGHEALLTATRFAALTSVSRERLRTWERRFGFPAPVREAGGPRRYRAGDVGRVIAVRRATAAGMPVAAAIAASSAAAQHVATGSPTLAEVVRSAPVPIVLLTGPRPLRVAWANPAAGEPAAGELVSPPLARCFAADAGPVEVEHPAWSGAGTLRSLAFPVPGPADAAPLVALVAVAGEGERHARSALDEARAELASLRRRADRHARWLDALAELATEFQRDPGPGLVGSGLDVLIRSTNAVDGGLATYRSGVLELSGSRRGLVTGGTLIGAAHPDLARALRDRQSTWLTASARAGFGVPRALEASFVPVAVGGEPLGALVTCFNEVEPHDDDNRRLLALLGATFGFAVLRDRLTRELAVTAARRP